MKSWRILPVVLALFAMSCDDGELPRDCSQCVETCEACRPDCVSEIVTCNEWCDEPNRICGDGYCLGEVERCIDQCPADPCDDFCGCD